MELLQFVHINANNANSNGYIEFDASFSKVMISQNIDKDKCLEPNEEEYSVKRKCQKISRWMLGRCF